MQQVHPGPPRDRPEIDAQHRRIFEVIAHADEGKPTDEILKEFFAYAGDRFTAVERIAEEHNVLDKDHVKAHHDLLDKIAACTFETKNMTPLVRKFLVDWVTTHIDQEDRELVKSINVGIRLQDRMERDR